MVYYWTQSNLRCEIMKKMLLVVLILSSNMSSEVSQSWPMFMHDPQHTGFAACAAPDTVYLSWVYDAQAPIAASPIIIDGTVFLAARGKMVALQAETGNVIWSHKIPVMGSTPAICDGIIVVGTTTGFVALDSETGELIWDTFIYESFYNTEYDPFDEFFSSSPVIIQDRVYVGAGTNLEPGTSGATEEVMRLRNPLKNIMCMDINSGEILWEVPLFGSMGSSPAFYDNILYFSSATCYALDPDDGSILWRLSHPYPMSSSPVVVDDTVLISFYNEYGQCEVLRIQNGDTLWTREIEGSMSPTPAVSQGKVVVKTDMGDISALDIESGDLIWTRQLGNELLIKDWFIHSASASPAIADGKIFVGTANGLFSCLDLETGEILWQYQTKADIVASAAIVDEKVFVGSTDEKLYCFGIDPETYYEKARKYEEQGDTDRATEFYVRAKDYYQEKGDLDMVKQCTYELEGRRYFWVGFIVFCIIGAFLIYRKMSS